MSHSTFNSYLVLLNQSFGKNLLDESDTPVSGMSWSQATNYRANLLSDGFQRVNAETWLGATYHNETIVTMLFSKPVNTTYIVIFTRRNEGE